MNLINIIDLYGIDELFKDIVLDERLDKEVLINTILDKCALYEPIYTDLSLFNLKVKNFFRKYENTLYRLINAYEVEYNPIHNYDRYEDSTDDDVYSNKSSSDDVGKVSPFDAKDFVNNSKTENVSTNDSTDNKKHHSHIYGNIGVTTSAQMLEQELALRKKLNIYELIANYFFDEFMVRIQD